ncbi:MAG TPA: SBBP repeat-containing protein [Terriglobales bacterium]|nr:SBBP repeat-containing protein [Terriglobales bacterium]
MRLNRRGLGTGLLWRCILPAVVWLVIVGAAILGLASHTRPVVATSPAPIPGFASTTPRPSSMVVPSFGHLPLTFEPNQGQTDPSVKFMARGSGYALFLTGDDAVLSLQDPAPAGKLPGAASVIHMKLAGAQTNPRLRGTDPLPGRSNYLIGNDSSRWQRNLPQFARVRYTEVYPGIDLVYYGKQGELEYDFEVAPGANPNQIQLNLEGSKVKLATGDLVLETAGGSIRLQAPRLYQTEGATLKPVDGRFVLLAEHKVGFEVGRYDRSKTLVIDPVLSYSSYLGGAGTETLPSIAVDTGSNFYVAGATNSATFPGTSTSSYQKTLAAGATSNVFVAKFDPSGATLLFATYLGGSGTDTSAGIAVDVGGNPYIAGTTTSTNFPVTQTAFQNVPKTLNVPHAFVTQLDATGSHLVYSTYLSGSGTDTASGMTLDNKGFVYVIGITSSSDFPTAPSAGTLQTKLQGANAFFIAKLQTNTSGTNSLPFSSYFGGGNPSNGTVAGGAIAVDNNAAGSNIYITGGTNYVFTGSNTTTDFPITNAVQSCLNVPVAPGATPPTTCSPPTGLQPNDAFVAKINPGATTGPQLLYCTYLGGTVNDIGFGIGLDASGNAYITGSTNSSDFQNPTTGSPAGFQTSYQGSGGATNAFVAKVSNPITGTGTTSNLQLTYFSFIGGAGPDVGRGIVVDGIQGARVVGTTASSGLPVLNAIQSNLAGGSDAFVARLDTVKGTNTGSNQFLTYLGGSLNDTGTGIAIDTSTTTTYITGETVSTNFPKASPFQASLQGPQDMFAAKLGPVVNLVVTPTTPASNVNAGNQASFVYTILNNGDTVANVGFLDQLSTGSGTAPATFVSATATGGTCPTTATSNTVLCNLGIMNGQTSVNVSVNLTPTGPGTLGNSGGVVVPGVPFVPSSAKPVTVNAFAITATPTSQIVAAGNPAVYQLLISPQQNFTASIAVTCSAGLPGGTPPSVCKPSTTPITLQGTSPSTITLSISTFPRTTTTVDLRPPAGPFYATWLPVTGLAFLGLGIGTRVRRKGRILAGMFFLTLMTLVLLQPACGGHSSSTTTTGTPAGTYTVTVSASSGQFTKTTPITLVVQ